MAHSGASRMDESFCIGVDLGGTKTEAVLVRFGSADEMSFDVLHRKRIRTEQALGYDAIVAATGALIAEVSQRSGLDSERLSVGVGMPGSIRRRDGSVKNSNTECLNGRRFREDLSAAVGRRIAFENDANCFALAEASFGAARKHRSQVVFGAILGTGVGGGVVLSGRIWPGPQNLGGEWGHHAVGPWWREGAGVEPGDSLELGLSPRPVCYCQNTGCLELYLSGPAVERDYRRRSGAALALPEIAARRDTDVHAARAMDEMLEAFGRGLANLVDILDPSAIVLGGGVSNLEVLYTEGIERVRRYVFNDELTTPILKHELGDSAGVLGAAWLAGAPGGLIGGSEVSVGH